MPVVKHIAGRGGDQWVLRLRVYLDLEDAFELGQAFQRRPLHLRKGAKPEGILDAPPGHRSPVETEQAAHFRRATHLARVRPGLVYDSRVRLGGATQRHEGERGYRVAGAQQKLEFGAGQDGLTKRHGVAAHERERVAGAQWHWLQLSARPRTLARDSEPDLGQRGEVACPDRAEAVY